MCIHRKFSFKHPNTILKNFLFIGSSFVKDSINHTFKK